MQASLRSSLRHYSRRDDAVNQVLPVLDKYAGSLYHEASDFTYDDGRVELLLQLTGVLPVRIGANLYHCPVSLWLPLDFPSKPPIVFVLPSATLAVKPGPHVDPSGKVMVPYLDNWTRKSEGCSLSSLVDDELIPMFSARYPVVARQQQRAPGPPSSSRPESPAPPRPPPPAQERPHSGYSDSGRGPQGELARGREASLDGSQPRPAPPFVPGSYGRYEQSPLGYQSPPPPPLPAQPAANGFTQYSRPPDVMGSPHSRQSSVNYGSPPPPPPVPPVHAGQPSYTPAMGSRESWEQQHRPQANSYASHALYHGSSGQAQPPRPASGTSASPLPPQMPGRPYSPATNVGYAPTPSSSSHYGLGPPVPPSSGLPQLGQPLGPPQYPVQPSTTHSRMSSNGTGSNSTVFQSGSPTTGPPHLGQPRYAQPPGCYHPHQAPPQQGATRHFSPPLTAKTVPPPQRRIQISNILDSDESDMTSPVSPGSGSTGTAQMGAGHASSSPYAGAGAGAPPPLPPNPALLAQRAQLHANLTAALAQLSSRVHQELVPQMNLYAADLSQGEPAIVDEMQRLEAVKAVCGIVRARYAAVVEESERRLREYEARGEGPEVDEIVCSSTVVYNQLLDLVAEDAALEDTIYHLGRGLNSDTANIDLDQFLKRVRTLSREQFLKRATINKILHALQARSSTVLQQQQQHQREQSRSSPVTSTTSVGIGGGAGVISSA